MFFLLCRDRDGGEKKTHANRIKYTITTTTTTKRITRNLNRKLAEAAYCPTYFWFRNRFELKSNIGNQNRSGAERILFGWVSDVHTTNLIHAGTENWNQYSLGANANAEYCIRSQPFMLLPSWTVQPPGDHPAYAWSITRNEYETNARTSCDCYAKKFRLENRYTLTAEREGIREKERIWSLLKAFFRISILWLYSN